MSKSVNIRDIVFQLQRIDDSDNPVNEGDLSLFTAQKITKKSKILSLVPKLKKFVAPVLNNVPVTHIELWQGNTKFSAFSTMSELGQQTIESPSPLLVRFRVRGKVFVWIYI